MKTIRIVLLGLIIMGLGLLITQQYWLPNLVDQILEWQGVMPEQMAELPTDSPAPINNATSSLDYMSDWNWVDVQEGAVKFSYPNPLPTTYITAVDWPPQVTIVTEEFVCNATPTANGGTVVDRRTINNRTYCVTISGEGAAGSVYTTYTYAVTKGDVVETVRFTLRMPQCLNYDEPQQSKCIEEQSTFDVDAVVSRIVESSTLY